MTEKDCKYCNKYKKEYKFCLYHGYQIEHIKDCEFKDKYKLKNIKIELINELLEDVDLDILEIDKIKIMSIFNRIKILNKDIEQDLDFIENILVEQKNKLIDKKLK